MSANIVEFDSVSRRFGQQLALDNVSFEVQQGVVYGLVGSNGAGKTTIMKHILGLLRARQGTVHVFGKDPAVDSVEVLQRIGHLCEHRELPEWMRIHELMWYTQAHYPNWKPEYCQELLETFALDPTKRIRDLSKGMRAQVGLIAAVSHHPDLLLLDEPSTGLDAIVRKDILNAVIRAVADDGRTAIFSSHLLDEVERMSDQVLMIDSGRIVLQGTVEEIRQQHRAISICYPEGCTTPPSVVGVLSVEGRGRHWQLIAEGDGNEIRQRLLSTDGEILDVRPASLEEVFVARAGRSISSSMPPTEEEATCSA
ncbi:MAG: ABC transporter ATP-binding protein [Fuerstiella sp.]